MPEGIVGHFLKQELGIDIIVVVVFYLNQDSRHFREQKPDYIVFPPCGKYLRRVYRKACFSPEFFCGGNQTSSSDGQTGCNHPVFHKLAYDFVAVYEIIRIRKLHFRTACLPQHFAQCGASQLESGIFERDIYYPVGSISESSGVHGCAAFAPAAHSAPYGQFKCAVLPTVLDEIAVQLHAEVEKVVPRRDGTVVESRHVAWRLVVPFPYCHQHYVLKGEAAFFEKAFKKQGVDGGLSPYYRVVHIHAFPVKVRAEDFCQIFLNPGTVV